jgi:DNA-binding GntR family transcriptional regulator
VLSDEVADSIRHAIVSGELPAGERLIEDELASQLGVSRGPVREALVRLGLEGLVVTERHRGATVAMLSPSEAAEIYSLRAALERLAAERTCLYAANDEFDELARILGKIDALPKPLEKEAVANLDLEFHDAIFRAAHHDRLYRAWEGLRSQIFLFFIQGGGLRSDFATTWADDHQEILAALRTRKRALAIKVMEHHGENTYQRVLATIPAGSPDS